MVSPITIHLKVLHGLDNKIALQLQGIVAIGYCYTWVWPDYSGGYRGGGSGGRNPPLRAKHEYHYYATCL